MTQILVKTFIRSGTKFVGDLLTNPTNGTVLATTGAISGGHYLISFVCYSSVAALMDIQHRNSADDGNITSNRTNMEAGNEYPYYPSEVYIKDGERIRTILVGGITGDVQCSIFILPKA